MHQLISHKRDIQKHMARRLFAWILSGALVLGTAQTTVACAFHGYTPNPTLVDVLLTTDRILIGRIDPDDSSKYISLEALDGSRTSSASVDTSEGQDLTASNRSGGTVLIARDGAYGPWMELAVMDDRFRDLLDQVLKRKSSWQLGNDKDRLSFFANRINDPNPAIRRLAMQELDRATYSALRRVRLPAVQSLRQDLETGDEDLMPIRVLLAGLSRDDSYGDLLAAKLADAVQTDVAYLGAFATAYIEQDKTDAVRSILDLYLADDTLPLRTRERLLEALAIQYKVSTGKTRRFITKEVAALLRRAPDLKQAAALQFGFAILPDTQTPNARAKSIQSTVPKTNGTSGDR